MMKVDQHVLSQQASGYEAISLKARHLSAQNINLRSTIKDLQTQISSLRHVNQQLTKNTPQSIQVIINQLSKQNQNLQKSLFRQLKNNQQLSCDLLMKNQLITENENEYREIIANYQSKIYDLRVNMQTKQAFFSNVEDKILADKDQLYNLPNIPNVTYFNQMSQLKLLLERHLIQNAELRLITINKGDQIELLGQQLKICQVMLKNKEEWSKYQQKMQMASTIDRTKLSENNTRIHIEQQLTRYDAKYKYISWHNNRRNDQAVQIYELKMFITKLLRDREKVTQERLKMLREVGKKEQDLRIIREAYKMLEKEVFHSKIQVQFYRENFKELAKVSTERKIRFYHDFYRESVPRLEKEMQDRVQIINYWREYKKLKEGDCEYLDKIILKRKYKRVKRLVRSSSCIIRFRHEQKVDKRSIVNFQKEEGIFNFIDLQNHEMNSILGYTVEQASIIVRDEPQLFDGEISIIEKPFKSKFSGRGINSPDKKRVMTSDQS